MIQVNSDSVSSFRAHFTQGYRGLIDSLVTCCCNNTHIKVDEKKLQIWTLQQRSSIFLNVNKSSNTEEITTSTSSRLATNICATDSVWPNVRHHHSLPFCSWVIVWIMAKETKEKNLKRSLKLNFTSVLDLLHMCLYGILINMWILQLWMETFCEV